MTAVWTLSFAASEVLFFIKHLLKFTVGCVCTILDCIAVITAIISVKTGIIQLSNKIHEVS